jgi:endonuclease YncB( thermonuclease family)
VRGRETTALKFAATLLVLLLSISNASADVEGTPSITDGDTLRFGDTRVRLFGIDAPESKQACKRGGADWLCGQEAGKALRDKISDQQVTCVQEDIDRYERIVAVCLLDDGTDLNGWLVLQGYALAYRQYTKKYVEFEGRARDAERGLWAGEFMKPWEWRRRR